MHKICKTQLSWKVDLLEDFTFLESKITEKLSFPGKLNLNSYTGKLSFNGKVDKWKVKLLEIWLSWKAHLSWKAQLPWKA